MRELEHTRNLPSPAPAYYLYTDFRGQLPAMTFSYRRNLGFLQTLKGALLLAAAFAVVESAPAFAADNAGDKQIKEIAAQLKKQEQRLEDQEKLLQRQQQMLSQQSAIIQRQQQNLDALQASRAAETQPRVMPAEYQQPAPMAIEAAPAPRPTRSFAQNDTPDRPVGEAPKQEEQPPQVVESLPEGLAVLTPQGHFVATPSLEYTQTSNDRLVYRGVVIVPGINLGEVEASTDDQTILSSVLDGRYGITKNLEVEVRVPFVFADDRATLLSQGPSGSATQSIYIQGKGIGDVELSGRYQINQGLDDWPVFVANARVKTITGKGPYDIDRDSAGIAKEVALGSGFWGFQGGFSMLKVSDPAVLFASVGYLYSMPKDINKTIGGVFVGHVAPSNSVSASMGFGFAVNPDFSFSMGYEHSHVFPQISILGGTRQETTSLEVGAMTVGMSYRVSQQTFLNGNFEFGVTHDAPDLRAVVSLPLNY